MPSNLPEKNTYSKKHTSLSNRGFSQLHILVAVFALLGGLTVYNSNIKSSQKNSKDAQILGSSQSTREVSSKTGLTVTVRSTGATWDFYEFLCKTYEECSGSLETGHQLPIVSGGQTEGHEILIEPNAEWEKYAFIKYYVKNAWGTGSGQFLPVEPVSVSGSKIMTSPDGQSFVVSPLEQVTAASNNKVLFSN